MTGMMDDLDIPTFEEELDNACDILVNDKPVEAETTD